MNDPSNYKIDHYRFANFEILSQEESKELLDKYHGTMIPRNRVRDRGISTKIELEPKEYQIMILPHCTYFTADHLRNLIPPKSVFISQKMRF